MTQATSSSRTPTLRILVLIALVLSGVVGAFATISQAPEAVVLGHDMVREPYPIDAESALLPAPDVFVNEARFVRGDTLSELLARLRIDPADAKRLTTFHALHRLRRGAMVRAEVDANGRLRGLSYLETRRKAVSFERHEEEFRVTQGEAEYDVIPVAKSGVIRSSLFGAADASDIPDRVAIQLADIFGGDIDFHRDLRKGDRFSVVYEMMYHRGRPVRAGRVLATEFVNKGKALRAVYFAASDSGKGGGYYAPDGKSLRKAFLRSPLEFSRVTSRFGMRRHPIHSSWRAHKGVDYAAPIGTRVRAVGDGIVDFAGRKGGYGKVVILRHRGQNTTLYAHLNSFARGIHRGARVTQGETIAAVGRTGWATGPHVHYEFRVAGQARNPLTIALPAAVPVAAAQMAAFRTRAAELVGPLDLLASTNVAVNQ